MLFNTYYFDRFSFPYEYIKLPINFYLIKLMDLLIFDIFLLILFFVILESITWIFRKLFKKPEANLSFDQYFFLMIMFLVALAALDLINNLYKYKNIIQQIVSFIILFLIGKYFFNINEFIKFLLSPFPSDRKITRYYVLLLILFIYLLSSGLTILIANHDAKNLIEGAPGNYQLELIMNDSGSDFSNETLILFTVQDGNYYFVEKHVPAPILSPMYAVPINKVERANITRIVNNADNEMYWRSYWRSQIDKLVTSLKATEEHARNFSLLFSLKIPNVYSEA
jgi:hypothetical protein